MTTEIVFIGRRGSFYKRGAKISTEISRSLKHDVESRKLVNRLFDKLHSGEIGMTPEFKEKVTAAGGLKANWKKDALSHLDEINKHLVRCLMATERCIHY